MVFAKLEETMSGGNFHGEYPAKVRSPSTPKPTLLIFNADLNIVLILIIHLSRPLITWQLEFMNWRI